MDDDIDYDDYERIGRIFPSGFPGTCTLDYNHTIKRNDKVSKIQHADNPMLLIGGVACAHCTKMIRRGKE